jgi:tetratricopeptide (TPR) repeat protein
LAAAQYFRAWALVAAGQLPEALKALKRAEDLDRFSVITKTRVATLYAWTDSLSKAETVLRRVLAIDSTYALAHVSLAMRLSRMGRHAQALAFCHRTASGCQSLRRALSVPCMRERAATARPAR